MNHSWLAGTQLPPWAFCVDWQLNATYSTVLACTFESQLPKKITFVRKFYPVTSAVRLVVAGLVHEERLASGVLHIDGGSTLLQSISWGSHGYTKRTAMLKSAPMNAMCQKKAWIDKYTSTIHRRSDCRTGEHPRWLDNRKGLDHHLMEQSSW
jgi:hypothetical protein